MAGSVTGNLGSENITLRNMATEDTLEEILRVLSNDKNIVPKENKSNTGATDKNTQSKKENTEATKRGTSQLGDFISKFGSGAVKIVRNLDTEINNISYSFSSMARGQGAFSKTFEFAATSVAQLQEQFNAYSKMMQVGGVATSDFQTLRQEAAGLGTDLGGLSKLTEQYAYSLKVGSSFARGGLKKLGEAFTSISESSDAIAQFGRIGVLPQQITEQLMLAAEAQGGFGDVMKKYNGDAAAFGKGMLRSTQELNVFASAVGTNSRMMQEEMAKAQQKITNRLLMATLSDAQQKAVMSISGLTGSAEEAMQVMRALGGGPTSPMAGLFLATQNMTAGILRAGPVFSDYTSMVANGTDQVEALTKSGLAQFAKGLTDLDLKRVSDQVAALEYAGQADQARMLSQQLVWLKALKDSKPEELSAKLKELRENGGDASKTLDNFSGLQNEQVKLAKSTAALNTEINRLGLSIASGMMKGTNATLGAVGRNKDAVREYVNSYLQSFGFNHAIPDDILNQSNDKIEKWIQGVLESGVKVASTDTAANGIAGAVDTLLVKNLKGQVEKFDLNKLITDENVRKSTEAFKGSGNTAGTMVMGAMLQKNVKSLGAITAGDDANPVHSTTGKHPLGQALDFRVNTGGMDPVLAYKQAQADTVSFMKKEFGLNDKDFSVINERGAKGGDHIHVQVNSPEAMEKIMNKYKTDIARANNPAPAAPAPGATGDKPQAAAQEQPGGGKPPQATAGSVNNNVAVVSIAKPEWFEEFTKNSSAQQKAMVTDLGNKFESLASAIKRKLGN